MTNDHKSRQQHYPEKSQELENALAELRTLTDASPTAIYRADTEGNCTYVNRRWLEMSGMSEEEAMGKGWEAAIHPDDREQMLLDWKDFVKRDDDRWDHVYRFLHKNGAVTTVLGTESPIRDRMGKVVGYIGSNLDITERKRWEERMEDLARFPEEDRNPIIRVSAEGMVLYSNPAGEALLNCLDAEVGRLMPRAKFKEIRSIYETGCHGRISMESDQRLYDISVVPVPERRYANLYGRDITAQAEAEAALGKAHMRAIQQARLSALGEMASGIAHDFNNSLMPILGFADLLLGKPEQYMRDRDEMVSMLRQIYDAAEDARSIVQRLRLVHRQESEEEMQLVNLNEVIESSISLTRPRWKEQMSAKGYVVNIETELAALSRHVEGNASELREMMLNLIMNAVDSMPEGGRIDVRTKPLPDYIELQVTDNGKGMSEETLAKCLEPFYTTKGEQGSGLGLAMVNGIVERHNGTLAIESAVGEGTSISVMLPYATRAHRTPEEGGKEEDRVLDPVRVLVVDDDERALRPTVRFLERDNHHVTPLSSGSEAMAVLKTRAAEFDILISDRAMPEVRGDDLIQAAKALNPGIITVLLTGFGDIMDQEEEVPPGTDRVMGKPITLKELRAALYELHTSADGREP